MKTREYNRVKKQTMGLYVPPRSRQPYCRWKMASLEIISSITILKRPDRSRWHKSPRRDSCRILPSRKSSAMYIRAGEISVV
ncbi:hypothetical protein MLD38_003536 [Melastoma candidum]|uniref:Uncharacterized protein n=1 Tax=Melastoma candidum TaxID=119954 RepID=A0ACB9S3K5_9MYRT|nr:hypothetical protein MLD38_003536 [Melastoma candidum]